MLKYFCLLENGEEYADACLSNLKQVLDNPKEKFVNNNLHPRHNLLIGKNRMLRKIDFTCDFVVEHAFLSNELKSKNKALDVKRIMCFKKVCLVLSIEVKENLELVFRDFSRQLSNIMQPCIAFVFTFVFL